MLELTLNAEKSVTGEPLLRRRANQMEGMTAFALISRQYSKYDRIPDGIQ